MRSILRSGYTQHRTRKVITVKRDGKTYRYVRKAGTTRVASRPAPDVGALGKGPKLIGKLKGGMLTRYGYHPVESMTARRRALTKAIKVGREQVLAVFHRLHAIGTLTKRTLPTASRTYRRDRDWVRDTFFKKR
jgi:hypothetical protein